MKEICISFVDVSVEMASHIDSTLMLMLTTCLWDFFLMCMSWNNWKWMSESLHVVERTIFMTFVHDKYMKLEEGLVILML